MKLKLKYWMDGWKEMDFEVTFAHFNLPTLVNAVKKVNATLLIVTVFNFYKRKLVFLI